MIWRVSQRPRMRELRPESRAHVPTVIVRTIRFTTDLLSSILVCKHEQARFFVLHTSNLILAQCLPSIAYLIFLRILDRLHGLTPTARRLECRRLVVIELVG